MNHFIAKRVLKSELTWFLSTSSARRSSTRSKGFAIGKGIVTKTMNPGRRQRIGVSLRWFDGVGMQQADVALRRRNRSWFLEGEPIRSIRFESIDENSYLVVGIEQGSNGIGTDWTWTLDVVLDDDKGAEPLVDRFNSSIKNQETRLIPPTKHEQVARTVVRVLPAFGGGAVPLSGELSEVDQRQVMAWLLKHLSMKNLLKLLSGPENRSANQILKALGVNNAKASKEDLAALVIERFGAQLLASPKRRDFLARRRFPRRRVNYPKVSKWHPGKQSATKFAEQLDLPTIMGGVRYSKPDASEDIEAFQPLKKLHDYQKELRGQMQSVLTATEWQDRRAIVWLPTGTGKTRVMVETLLMGCRLEAPRNCILWIANRSELCEQAISEFRHVWTVEGYHSPSATEGGVPSLRFIRLWDARDWQDPPTFPTVIVASIQTLASRLKDDIVYEELLAILGRRCAAIVVDEAHQSIAPTFTQVMTGLGLLRRKNYLGDNRKTAPPLFGLTATPARSGNDETAQLAKRFAGQLLEPSKKYRSLRPFMKGGFLSHPKHEVIDTGSTLTLREHERKAWEAFERIPQSVLKRLGEDPRRTALIISNMTRRLELHESVLIFACSVQHARTMAEVLTRQGFRAASLDGSTPKPIRFQTIKHFKLGRIRFLVSCDLLTTGFDAPNVDAIVLARPVESRILYAQMVGRGLRGPKNGGTEECLILDYEDAAGPYSNLDNLRSEFRKAFLGDL